MPFVVTSQAAAADKAVPATLCEANLLGQPDQRRGKPILVRQISERTLLIEPDDRREIISVLHRDGTSTYAIDPSLKDFAASTRLARVQKASQLPEELHGVLTALPADDAILDHGRAISDWLKRG